MQKIDTSNKPFTIIANATKPNQIADTCTLAEAEALLAANSYPSPALLVLGPMPRTSQSASDSQAITVAL